MPIPSDTRFSCERRFFTSGVRDEQTNGGTTSCGFCGGREARVTVGIGFVVFSEAMGRWRTTLFGVSGDETGIDVSPQKC